MENDIESSYQVAVQMLNTETHMVWSRYNVFVVANSIIIAAMGLKLPVNEFQTNSLPYYLVLCLVISGMFICLFWGILSVHGFYVCSRYNTIVREIEKNRKLPVLNCEVMPTSGKLAPLFALLTISLFLIIYCFMWAIPSWTSFANLIKGMAIFLPVGLSLLIIFSIICSIVYFICKKKHFDYEVKGRFILKPIVDRNR